MKRVIIHWTAGAHSASDLDRDHYHVLIEGDGNVVLGKHKPEANLSTGDGVYAAHVRMFNTGSIGVAVCAMAGAEGWPTMKPGRYPITAAQIDALSAAVADLCETYSIPVARETVLTHAEVEPTHGVTQRGELEDRAAPEVAPDPVPFPGKLIAERLMLAESDLEAALRRVQEIRKEIQ